MNVARTSEKIHSGKSPILLCVLPVIFFFLHNVARFMELVFTADILLLFTVYALLSILLFLACRNLLRLSPSQAMLVNTCMMIGFLFFGIVQDWLVGIKKYSILGDSFFLLAVVAALLTVQIIYLKKKKKEPVKTNQYFRVLFSLLICLELVIAGVKAVTGKSMQAIVKQMTTPVLADKKLFSKDKPDIYHIIFDEYTSSAAIKKYWHYDNDLDSFLLEKGFFIIDSANSNYSTTPFSLNSMFNFQYLKGVDPFLERNSADFYIGQMLFMKNELFRFLKNEQYDISVFSQIQNKELLTTFGILGVVKPSSWLRNQTLERLYLNPWIFNKIKGLLGQKEEEPTLITASKKKFLQYNGEALEHILSTCRRMTKDDPAMPAFVFTHFMLPHEPYILDENGNYLPPSETTDNMKGYLRQLKYSNKLIREITACLLSDTTRKKIIIFQGDHGYRSYAKVSSRETYRALSAVYYYDRNYTGIRKSLSHVNTYRMILNKYWGAGLPLLSDSLVMKNKKTAK